MSWILLRGLTREARHWGDFTSRFSERLAEATALDLPGNGEFATAKSPTSVRGMVEFARQQLQLRGFKPPYRLLAMSLGGMVATDWAQSYPTEVEALVLVNTSMRPYSSLPQRLRPANWPALGLLAARWGDADYAERAIHAITCNQTASKESDIAAWLDIRKSAPVSEANAQRQLWAAARFVCAPTPPACRTLLLSSAADHLVHPACSNQLAQAWSAVHQQHPWAGHDLPHDDTDWVCDQLVDWLRVPGQQ
ncbi:MAG: alpha/beta hydrolase [Polaromonas sp.]|nr:alpha/beta hydrolase [Polaromonas sp.]